MTALGFYAFPFLLSSNILVVVGTTVAERVIYLPSLGVCMGFALVLSSESSLIPLGMLGLVEEEEEEGEGEGEGEVS